jgi:hypothetical protein
MKFDQDYLGITVFSLIAIAFLFWWVWARAGNDKRWFVAPWPVISRSFYFALPTAMLGILVIVTDEALSINNQNSTMVSTLIAFGLWVISFVIAYIEPDLMCPPWYRWLKKKHNDIMPYLVRDAYRLGREAWLEQVKTQEGLEEWANEVRCKYTM